MSRFRVLICGGGVAAMEGLLRLRRLAGDALDLTLIAPNEEFAFRALAVNEPFGYRSAERYPVEQIASDAGAEWVRAKLARVDASASKVETDAGDEHAFDALLLAVGSRLSPAFDDVTTFDDTRADEIFNGIVQDVEYGYLKSVAFVQPSGPSWPLPLYELALMTAERSYGMGINDAELSLITPEEMPLGVFGHTASAAVTERLEQARIRVHTHASPQVAERGVVRLGRDDEEVRAARIVSMPKLSGPDVEGVPARQRGFIPIDRYCLVPDTGGQIFAAGDATAYPVKHGGLGAQQADTAASGIARLAGVDVDAKPFQPEIRGILFTGPAHPLYLRAAGLISGEGFESQVSAEPLWDPADKVVADELDAYLARLRG